MFFFFNDTATTEIYTLSLHDALPISGTPEPVPGIVEVRFPAVQHAMPVGGEIARRILKNAVRAIEIVQGVKECAADQRSEEHTSELQSRQYLVCRLLLEKKKIPSTYA